VYAHTHVNLMHEVCSHHHTYAHVKRRYQLKEFGIQFRIRYMRGEQCADLRIKVVCCMCGSARTLEQDITFHVLLCADASV
jgi:hypothetical protein